MSVFNVLGNEYDLLVIGETEDPRTLHRIDALCKTLGFVARTHPAVEASAYATLVRETAEIVHGTRIGKADTRRKPLPQLIAGQAVRGEPVLVGG